MKWKDYGYSEGAYKIQSKGMEQHKGTGYTRLPGSSGVWVRSNEQQKVTLWSPIQMLELRPMVPYM